MWWIWVAAVATLVLGAAIGYIYGITAGHLQATIDHTRATVEGAAKQAGDLLDQLKEQAGAGVGEQRYKNVNNAPRVTTHRLLMSIPHTDETHPGPFQECDDSRCFPAWPTLTRHSDETEVVDANKE